MDICDNILLHTQQTDMSMSVCDAQSQHHISASVLLPLTVTKLQDGGATF